MPEQGLPFLWHRRTIDVPVCLAYASDHGIIASGSPTRVHGRLIGRSGDRACVFGRRICVSDDRFRVSRDLFRAHGERFDGFDARCRLRASPHGSDHCVKVWRFVRA